MAEKYIKCSIKVTDAGTNAIDLPAPADISFGKERICKEQRAMDGTMIIDMIAVKNSYELVWDIMDGSTMAELRDALESSEHIFFDLAIEMKIRDVAADSAVTTSKFGNTVYLSDISYMPYFVNGGFVWKDVSIKFVER